MAEIQSAPLIRPRPCIGSLLDIPLGRYYKGKYGDNLLSGGATHFQLTGGRGNTFKSVFSSGQEYIVLDRYPESSLTIYDTEMTLGWDRIEDLTSFYENIDFEECAESGRIKLTSAGEYSGNEFWALIRDISNDRAKNFKREAIETPFINKKGDPIKILPPKMFFIDSLSEFEVDMIAEIHDKNQIDDGAAQTVDMRSSGAKSRMIRQVPTVSAKGGMYFTMTSHVGDEIKIDPYAPAKQLLGFLKKGLKFKNTPEKASFLSNLTWFISQAEVLSHSDKTTLYPAKGQPAIQGDTDLQCIHLINARSKHGPAGHTFTLVVSQTEGLKPSLSEFYYLKSRKDKYGLLGPEGIGKDYRCVLYPEPLLKRKEVRDLTETDKKLKRALEITSEMRQIYDYWVDFPKSRIVHPEELYKGLKEMGYDWDVLLDTRGHWTFDHYTNPVRPISTMDFIDMYHGDYIPWWFSKEQKAAIDLSKAKK